MKLRIQLFLGYDLSRSCPAGEERLAVAVKDRE